MNMPIDRSRITLSRCLLAVGLLLALPLLAMAQSTDTLTIGHHAHGAAHKPIAAMKAGTDPHAMHGAQAPAAATSTYGADHAHMHHMTPAPASQADHHAMHSVPADATPAAPHAMDHDAMHGVDHAATRGAKHAMPAATPHAHGAAAEPMPHAHGATAPVGTRSPDYSDGIGHSNMPGTHMLDNQPLAMLRVDQLEATHGRHINGQAWVVQGWYGNDDDKLWLRSEGQRQRGRVEDAEVELLWNHAIAPFWDTQLGLRQDLGDGPQRQWAAFGIQGLAPYWFELEATAYVGSSGRTAARLHAEYELLFTQRLILQPEFELNLHGRNDAATRTGRGLSDTKLGLRLRYEVRRELAPYIGVVWTHRYGASAGYARQDGEPATDRQFVAGVRFWF